MKKFFTYLFASATFCMIGTVNAMAQEADEEDLTPDMFMNYKDPENPVETEAEYHVGEELGGGAVVIGSGSLWPWLYVDLSEYDYLKAETNGVFARIFMNRIGDNGQCTTKEFSLDVEAIDGSIAWVQERYYTISEDQTVYTVNLAKMVADYGYAHLNGIKFPWNDGGNICESIVVGKGTPTGVKEVSLMEVIKAQQYNLAGQKVSDNAKGLVIKNGKKYIK